jgi:hypothetical protein
MNVLRWLTGTFSLSSRGKALILYRRGMMRAKKHEYKGAIDDYTTLIGMPDTISSMKAMALYNRALVYAAVDADPHAFADLSSVLSMAEAPTNVRTEARRKLLRMQRRSETTDTQDGLKTGPRPGSDPVHE